MATTHYWEENGQNVKYENYNSNEEFPRAPEQLNFTAQSEDEADYPPNDFLKKAKVSRQDPMSHRIIEKRRRDRMNNCLADLSRLIPPEYLKKGRGRVEKTEIIEMSIRHIKHLQERANGLYHTDNAESNYAAEKQVGEREAADHFTSGYQEAVTETVRFLVENHCYGPSDGLCVQLATHLRRHFEHITKGKPHENRLHLVSSSETTSSSSIPHSFVMKGGVIARTAPPEVARYTKPYESVPEPYESVPEPYGMDCDRVSEPIPLTVEDRSRDPPTSEEPLPLDDVRQQPEPTLRNVRKTEYTEDYLHSYKFKNSIERRFSRSQDCEVHDMSIRSAAVQSQAKAYSQKRRRAAKLPVSTSTSNSGSTEEARDTSPQDTSSESPHYHYEKPVPSPTQLVPVFALNALGKFYIPMSVDYACLSRHLDNYDALDTSASHHGAPLHPVTIHVNFQPSANYQVKREPNRDWRAE